MQLKIQAARTIPATISNNLRGGIGAAAASLVGALVGAEGSDVGAPLGGAVFSGVPMYTKFLMEKSVDVDDAFEMISSTPYACAWVAKYVVKFPWSIAVISWVDSIS